MPHVGPLSEDSQNTWFSDSSDVVSHRRRGDRIDGNLLRCVMSASLIGRLGSSAFRLSTTAVSMSLAGSCFSPDSALGPFHHGIRGQGGTIFWAAFPSRER